MAKKRGLGRSLDALLGGVSSQHEKTARVAGTPDPSPTSETAGSRAPTGKSESRTPSTTEKKITAIPLAGETDLTASANGDRLHTLPIDRIRRGSYQPRQQFDQVALQELADSLKSQGLIQPILVRPFADGYEIIAGERRWRAAQLAGMHDIPAIIRDLDDQSVAAVSLIENIQRKDLNPMEEARALQRLQSEFDMTHQAVADAVGRSRAAVTNLMRLLDLHDEVKVMVDRGELDMGHARALLGLEKEHQIVLAREIVKKGLSVRATEQLVKGVKSPTAAQKPEEKRDPDIVALEKRLGDTLGAGVTIRHQESGKGKLEISYTSLDELDGIIAHIQ